MALTDAQMTDVRYYMGHQAVGTIMPITENQDLVYCRFGMVIMSLYKRLTSLSSTEETRLISKFLTPLALREAEIQTASDNLDTDVAAVWTRNKNEVADRVRQFNRLRLELCNFLGCEPGPGLAVSNTLQRC